MTAAVAPPAMPPAPEPRYDDVPVDRDITFAQVVALLLVAVGGILLFAVTLRRLDLQPPALPLNIGAKLVTATVALAVVDRLGWWNRVGFRRPSRWPRLWLAWLPGLYVFFVFRQPFPDSGVLRTAGIGLLALAVGLDEEVWMRGLALESVRHRGTTAAVLISAALFALLHSVNVISGQPVSTTGVQLFVALSFGIALGALRVRTHTIWPCILVHAAWDFALILASGEIGERSGTSVGQAGVTVAIMTPLLVYGLVLARPSKVPGPDGLMRRPLTSPEVLDLPGPAVRAPETRPADALGPWPAPPPDVEAIFRGW